MYAGTILIGTGIALGNVLLPSLIKRDFSEVALKRGEPPEQPEKFAPYEMAIMTADFFGLNKDLIKKSDSTRFTQPAKRPMKTGFIIDKARKQLGFEPKTFRTGIGILAKQIILARS